MKDTLELNFHNIESNIQKKGDTIIVIEHKGNSTTKEFVENPIFVSLIIPVIIIAINVFISKYLLGRKDKAEVKRIDEEIKQMKSSFQPIVLSTIQKTQEFILNDKVSALKEIVGFRIKLYSLEQFYISGTPFYEDEIDYYRNVYEKINRYILDDFRRIEIEKGYLFPNSIMNNIHSVQTLLSDIFEIQGREYSVQNREITDEVKNKLIDLSTKFDLIIDQIRQDLHLDDKFIHDFIDKHKTL